jgi:hypothetical protein
MAEERVALWKAAPAQNWLGTAIGQCVQGRKPLKHTDWVIRGQDRNSGAELDFGGSGGDGSEQNFGRRDGKV